ncbi:Protein OS-9 [Coemansia sp. RSA 1200]|nr:Protein OS-9 [Coemansia sp. RSA 1200]
MALGIPHESVHDKVNGIAPGTSRDIVVAALGPSYSVDGNSLVWTCPGHSSGRIAVEFVDGCVVGTTTLVATILLLAATALCAAAAAANDDRTDGMKGAQVFDPAVIMEDVYETPRFRMVVLEEPIPASQLNRTVASIRQEAEEAEKSAATAAATAAAAAGEDEDNGDKDAPVVAYDALVMPDGASWKLLCKIPRVIDTREEEQEKQRQQQQESRAAGVGEEEMSRMERRRAIERGVELLDPLKSDCITYVSEYWLFEYCHNMHVRQFYRSTPDRNGRVLEVEYRLGDYASRKPVGATTKADDDDGNGSGDGALDSAAAVHGASSSVPDDADAALTTRISAIGRTRFLTQVWGGGTLCDITRQPRQVEVQFHCDANGPERIALVEEIESCRYVVVVNTPRLCADAMFYNAAVSAVHDIQCQHVVPDHSYRRVVDSIRGKTNPAEAVESAAVSHAEETASVAGKPGVPQPQLVIALNDPRLAELTRNNEDALQRFLAMVYGDPKLRVQFEQGPQLKGAADYPHTTGLSQENAHAKHEQAGGSAAKAKKKRKKVSSPPPPSAQNPHDEL